MEDFSGTTLVPNAANIRSIQPTERSADRHRRKKEQKEKKTEGDVVEISSLSEKNEDIRENVALPETKNTTQDGLPGDHIDVRI